MADLYVFSNNCEFLRLTDKLPLQWEGFLDYLDSKVDAGSIKSSGSVETPIVKITQNGETAVFRYVNYRLTDDSEYPYTQMEFVFDSVESAGERSTRTTKGMYDTVNGSPNPIYGVNDIGLMVFPQKTTIGTLDSGNSEKAVKGPNSEAVFLPGIYLMVYPHFGLNTQDVIQLIIPEVLFGSETIHKIPAKYLDIDASALQLDTSKVQEMIDATINEALTQIFDTAF